MAMTDAEIQAQVKAILSRADRAKDAGTNRSLLALLFGVLILPVIAYFLSSNVWGFGIIVSVIITVLAPVVGFLLVAVISMGDDGRRAERTAEHFRESFPPESGAFETALDVLRTARTKSEVEKDLLEVLDGVAFEPGPGLMGELGLEPGGSLATGQSGPATDDEFAKKDGEPSCDYVPLDPYGAGQRPGSLNGASEPSTQSVKLTLCVFRCGNCGATLKAPELIADFRDGEFLLRSRGSSRLAYLYAPDGPAGETFNEVSELLEQSKRAKRLSDDDRADLLHEIVGYAFDEDADGFPFSMKEPPECPECGSHETAFVEEPDPPENVDVDVAVLTTVKWQKLSRAEKKDFVLEILTGL